MIMASLRWPVALSGGCLKHGDMGQYSESVYFGPLKVREKKCLRNGKSFVELENYVALCGQAL